MIKIFIIIVNSLVTKYDTNNKYFCCYNYNYNYKSLKIVTIMNILVGVIIFIGHLIPIKNLSLCKRNINNKNMIIDIDYGLITIILKLSK